MHVILLVSVYFYSYYFPHFTGPNKPYTPIIPSSFFTKEVLDKLKKSGKINGVMVTMTDQTDVLSYPPQGFSSDQQCPNLASSIYEGDDSYSCKSHKYNPKGNGLMLENFGIPIVLLKSEPEVQTILDCYHKHNMPTGTGKENLPEYPLCSVEIKAYMHGAGNTEICWRRNSMIRNFAPESYCSNLGGHSSHAFLNYNHKKEERNKTIVVTTRTDSFSLFELSEPGASSPAPGITVMMAVAEALRPVREEIMNAGYNILFLAVTGEAWDYIGSQRVVYDMQRDAFPQNTSNEPHFKLSQVHLVFELSHFINALNNSKELFAHSDPKTASKHAQVDDFIQVLQAQVTGGVQISKTAQNQPLPPASAQMFIREEPDTGVAAVLLADYNREFKTDYYNSYLDTYTAHGFYPQENSSTIDYEATTIQGQLLADIATAVARALYAYSVNSGNVNSINANPNTTSRLLYCFLVSPKCDIFMTIVSPANFKIVSNTNTPFPFFVSVYYAYSRDNLQQLVYKLLAYYTGQQIDVSSFKEDKRQEACKNISGTVWMSGHTNSSDLMSSDRTPMCWQSAVQFHKATSPAFELDNYNFSSTKYSTWAESIWPSNDAFHVRLFLQPSAEVELASMIAGISAFILTAVLAILVQRRSATLFPPHDDMTLITQQSAPVNNPDT